MNLLPNNFLKQMENILKNEYHDFLATYDKPHFQGLRINRLKISTEDFRQRYGAHLGISSADGVPWCSTGFYHGTSAEGEAVSKSPLYHAGLYYIQEPSAMAPVEFMDIETGMKVLDLCAAPGGKSVQIATKLEGKGLLVSNDISLKRTKAILKNIEIQGIKNALVTNGSPEELAEFFGDYFDRILVDAPCSGEGMFRKDPAIIRSYEEVLADVEAIQHEILSQAATMLRPGGKLVYSTCTFNPAENEEIIQKFLAEHVDFEVVNLADIHPQASSYGFQPGLKGIGFRLYPHHLKGEGHFLCLLEKKKQGEGEASSKIRSEGNFDHLYPMQALAELVDDCGEINRSGSLSTNQKNRNDINQKNKGKSSRKTWKNTSKYENDYKQKGGRQEEAGQVDYKALLSDYQANQLETALEIGKLVYENGAIYNEIIDTQGAKFRIIRNGLYLGDIKNEAFTPSPAFIMAMEKQDFQHALSFAVDDGRLVKFLKGETLDLEETDGTYIICLDEYPLGYVKVKNQTAKNFYNKNWRLL